MNNTRDFLKTPYKYLPVSKSMKRFFAVHGIPNLEKLLEIKPVELMEKKWFSARLFRELILFKEENGIDYD